MHQTRQTNTRKTLVALTNFIFEAGILQRTPRSGLWFLGTGEQSVAEHISRACYIAFVLCYLTPKAKREKVVNLVLFHDFAEGRTSDLNHVHQKYGRLAETAAIEDLAKEVPFGDEMKRFHTEAKQKKTLEARIAKDADNLEWMLSMREEESKGNTKARVWARDVVHRLQTPAGIAVGSLLMKTDPDHWFMFRDHWTQQGKKVDKKTRRRKHRP